MARTLQQIWIDATPATIKADAEEAAKLMEAVAAPSEEDGRYIEGLYMIWDAVHPGEPFPGSEAARKAARK